MANLTRAQAQSILKALGWRVDTSTRLNRAILNFQAGYNFGRTGLAVDGKLGPLTSNAMRYSYARLQAKKPTASPHFSFTELRCQCGGKYASCWRIWAKRSVFAMLEDYRASSGNPLTVVSGCRCPSHNKAVGGSATSRHPKGLAADVPPRYSVNTVKGWRLATHIGYSPSLRKVVHIDLGEGGSKTNPIVYKDGR